MLDNHDICSRLGLYAKLGELHEENPFKIKAYSAAAFNLKKIKDAMSGMTDDQLSSLPGMGKSVLAAVKRIIATGSFPELDEKISSTPPGIIEMLGIKGLGPKKVGVIWRNMGIETVDELFDACRQNRLVEQPGFGYKTQGEIMHAIQFSLNAKGYFHYARVEEPAISLLKKIQAEFSEDLTEFTGDFRRQCEVLDAIDIITTIKTAALNQFMIKDGFLSDNNRDFYNPGGFRFRFHFTDKNSFGKEHFISTGSAAHLTEIGLNAENVSGASEEEIYRNLGLPFIPAYIREGIGESKRVSFDEIIRFEDIKGTLHNHTTYSDGLNSLREMAEHARLRGYEYLAVCDHSRSAGYANGLSEERVLVQFAEIDQLNKELAPFRIFKGIESDILSDGSLDYSDAFLSGFDLVVASIHSNLKMTEEKAMQRLIRAIENPYTRILGHPTGRLLLVRQGYPIDHKYIIDACAANDVVIELNANPYRLDLDWRWIPYAMEKGVKIAINPDAHEKEGYDDMYFGALVAAKGGLTKEMTLNTLGLGEFETWLKTPRKAVSH